MLEFWATAFGSGLGVVAGVLVQYGVEKYLGKDKSRRQISNVRAEAIYNSSLINEMISETSSLRAASQPGLIGQYYGYFANGGAFWVALNKFVTDGDGYAVFTSSELQAVQKAQRWLSAGTENWVFQQISENKISGNIPAMLALATHIEKQCRETLATLTMLSNKKL